jgi:hypothetical protein
MRGRTIQNDLDTLGAQPASDPGESLGEGIGPLSPPPPPGTLMPLSPGGHFSSTTWQRERVSRLVRIFRCVEQGRKSGKRLHRQLVRFACRWNGKRYTCDPTRSMHLSYPTLVRLYYLWRTSGKAALELRYRCPNQRIKPAELRALLELCLQPQVFSFSAAYRQLPGPLASIWAYRYATPGRLRAALAALLAHRRRERVLQRAARALLEGLL